jgi:hypothetical protein
MTGTMEQRLSHQVPIKWWRTFRADEFDQSRVSILRTTLSTIAILEESTWRSATGGSAAAAIGLALRLNPDRSTSTAYDLIVTSLAICAADGNPVGTRLDHVQRSHPFGMPVGQCQAGVDQQAMTEFVRECARTPFLASISTSPISSPLCTRPRR